MSYSKIIAIIIALVLTNLISLKQNADLFAKSRDVDPEFVQEGVASWYGPGFQGRKTASGERFNTYEMTAAHKTLPFNTLLRVTNLNNGISTVVRINDRGPYVRGRIIDLSNAAKNEIQMGGTADVRIEIFNPDEEAEQQKESEDNTSPVNLFEQEYPAASKIFVEWIKDSTNEGNISDEQINQIFNSSKIKIKVLTPDVTDANSRIYQEMAENSGFNYFDVTRKVKFITGYTIEVAGFSDKKKASDLIENLESEKFQNVFLEEIINSDSTNYKVYVGNYETTSNTKDDYVKLMNVAKDSKLRIVKIGN